jgi:hypothetical protein
MSVLSTLSPSGVPGKFGLQDFVNSFFDFVQFGLTLGADARRSSALRAWPNADEAQAAGPCVS